MREGRAGKAWLGRGRGARAPRQGAGSRPSQTPRWPDAAFSARLGCVRLQSRPRRGRIKHVASRPATRTRRSPGAAATPATSMHRSSATNLDMTANCPGVASKQEVGAVCHGGSLPALPASQSLLAVVLCALTPRPPSCSGCAATSNSRARTCRGEPSVCGGRHAECGGWKRLKEQRRN